jgi:hypothetical protein
MNKSLPLTGKEDQGKGGSKRKPAVLVGDVMAVADGTAVASV